MFWLDLLLEIIIMEYRKFFLAVILIILAGWLSVSCSGDKMKSASNETAAVDSLSVLNESIKSDSLDVSLYNQRARYFLKRNQLNSALQDIRKAIEISPSNPGLFLTLSDIYLGQGKIRQSAESLERVIELDPVNNDAYLKLAELGLIVRSYDKAFQFTAKALELKPHNPVAYFIRGYASLETGDTLSAVDYFVKAVNQDQDYFEALLQLGVLFSEKKDRRAFDYLNSAVRLRPSSTDALYALAMYHQGSNELEPAKDLYAKILSINAQDEYALFNLGYIALVFEEEYVKAEEYFSRAISADPSYADAYYNRGFTRELLREYTNARLDYKQVLVINPDYSLAIDALNRLDSQGL
ncbi:MAG: tetratricopeptide repeat protein [Bacteroidetes bacterium]|nr:tetratricopeptide repeat protein [Bacteroidota bacterium]